MGIVSPHTNSFSGTTNEFCIQTIFLRLASENGECAVYFIGSVYILNDIEFCRWEPFENLDKIHFVPYAARLGSDIRNLQRIMVELR